MNTIPPLIETAKPRRRSKFLRRSAFIIAAFFTLIAAAYAIVDWRGHQAWQKCQRELKARGEQLDWAAYIPARVPDGQNFIKTPLLEAVGYRGRIDTNVWQAFADAGRSLDWQGCVDSQSGRKMVWGQADAAAFLQALQEIEPRLDELRAANFKPFARFDIDRSRPFEESPGINFVALRILSQIVAFHACAELTLNQSEKAFQDIHVIHRLSDGLKEENTLVALMFRVALQGLSLEPFWEGWAEGRWSERELTRFGELFARVDLLPELARVMHAERAGVNALVEKYGIQGNEFGRVTMRGESAQKGFWNGVREQAEKLGWKLIPRGWVYQNLVGYNHRMQAFIPLTLQSKPPTLSPAEVNQMKQRVVQDISNGPYNWLSRTAIPNFGRALETVARIQTMVNEAGIVCALERCRLTRGQYPESLTELVPSFLSQLPVDVINGGPLKYRRTNDSKFLLYSVGWNEADDGGAPAPRRASQAKPDYSGDWVWQYPVDK